MTFARILCAIGLHSGPVESMGRVWKGDSSTPFLAVLPGNRRGRFGTEYHYHCCGKVKTYWDKRR